jgi:hypothetical protein
LTSCARATPSTLLTRELWCASPSPALWLQTRGTYANSCAVMSVAGWLLGLGDRHLDNILLDVRSGELLHIDYNVCFERGLKLRIAERVPFRMTQNMEAALGPCGVEGQFRRTCERVMTALGASRELLLTLLEAFIYDPLADWTGESDAADLGHTRQELQLALALVTERADELRALAERDADDAQVAELAREPALGVAEPVIPAVVQRSLHAPQLFRAHVRADELAAAEQQLHRRSWRGAPVCRARAMQRCATAESALQAERDEAAVLRETAPRSLRPTTRSPTCCARRRRSSRRWRRLATRLRRRSDASDVPPLRDAARLLEGPPSPQQAKREQSDRELLRGCAEVDAAAHRRAARDCADDGQRGVGGACVRRRAGARAARRCAPVGDDARRERAGQLCRR